MLWAYKNENPRVWFNRMKAVGIEPTHFYVGIEPTHFYEGGRNRTHYSLLLTDLQSAPLSSQAHLLPPVRIELTNTWFRSKWLYRLSMEAATDKIRTCIFTVKSGALYPLSYGRSYLFAFCSRQEVNRENKYIFLIILILLICLTLVKGAKKKQ